jgi:hypothetical protein
MRNGIILLPPTFLMGGTFPGLIKLFNDIRGQDIHSVGKEVGGLYSLNTLGGVMGAFGAGFFLIQFLGMKNTVYLAGIMYFICTGLLYLFNREPAGKSAKNEAPRGKPRGIKPGEIKPAKKESNLDNPYIFLSNFIMTGVAVDAFTADQPLNTDDHPVIEFINPKLVDRFQERGLTNLTALNEATKM